MARYQVLDYIANHSPGDVVVWADDESGVNVERLLRNGRVKRLDEPKAEAKPAPKVQQLPQTKPATTAPKRSTITRKH